ncbi:putative porin [Oxalobacteraceae bacterium GrIS 1.11]
MKKSLLALAILASFAGAASAQSSVTVYGVVDAGLAHETGSVNGAVNKVATGVQSGNRLGFKGTEDLGSGLKANFQLESGFNLDTGTSRQGGALFGRQAYAGLSGNFGAINLGRQYDPIFVSMDSIDPFSTGLPGATTNLMNAGNVRTNNAITYSTPDMGGFSATGLYGAGEVNGDSNANRTLGLSATYANGPLLITAAYDKINANDATAGSTGQKLFLTGATYNFGVLTAHAAYESDKSDTSANGAAPASNTNYRDFLVGVTVPVGPGSIIADFIKKSDRIDNSARGGKQFAVGYLYSLSKRTNLYTSYSRIKNDDNGRNFVSDASSGGDAAQTVGGSSSALAVGIRHKF